MRFCITILGLFITSCIHAPMGEEYARKSLNDALADADEVRFSFPEGDPVLDEGSAIALADALLFEIYGEGTIKDERPYEIYLINGYWIMKGTVPLFYDGGTFEIIFEAESRKIIRLTHYK